jgi:hypothetical protein
VDSGRSLRKPYVLRIIAALWVLTGIVDEGSKRSVSSFFSPYPRQCILYFLLEAFDQFAVGGDQPLLGFNFGDDGMCM